uniref:SET domain-containing protein n=1 Tax=Ananas comosus var. bracteatus TaxID=296719 RepID=A0A6V7QQL5_ANACO
MQIGVEDELHHLRSKATELLLKEDWKGYIDLYTHLISLCGDGGGGGDDGGGGGDGGAAAAAKVHKTLCVALSNRAEARARLRDLSGALEDLDRLLQLDPSHLKTLVSKGKILLDLGRYSRASECFRRALSAHGAGGAESLRALLDRARRLEVRSRTGSLDLSDWILNRGLFVTKSVESGTPLIVTKAVVIGRGILPEASNTADGSGDGARMVMWKDFVDRIISVAERCPKTLALIYALSTGEDEDDEQRNKLTIPSMNLFNPDAEDETFAVRNNEIDMERILKVLDVNCLTENSVSAKVWGKNSGYSGVGLWVLPSFLNHCCAPSVRRLHIDDWVIIHACRDIKAGEEITSAYFDVLSPLDKRREMAKRWGFKCECESEIGTRDEEMGVKEKGRGFIRASFWASYESVYSSEKLLRKWKGKVPKESEVGESIGESVGGDERVLKMVMKGLKRGGGVGIEVERALRLGRGTYGKVMKRQAMRAVLEQI